MNRELNSAYCWWAEKCDDRLMLVLYWISLIARFAGPTWAHLGTLGRRYFIWFMAPVSMYQVNPSIKRLLDTWLGFRYKLIPHICVVHPNEQYSHGCYSLIGVLFWCILHFVLYCTIDLSRTSNRPKMYLVISRGIKQKKLSLIYLSISLLHFMLCWQV